MSGGMKPPSGGGNIGDPTKTSRSTRAAKPNVGNQGFVGTESAKSRLADGVRSKPASVPGNGSQQGASAQKRQSGTNDAINDAHKKGNGQQAASVDTNNRNAGVADSGNKPGVAPATNGAMDKAKGLGANATGVDYSDKNMKDRLEHQAADVAMDATPGLAQANSARKALKEFNKAKKAAGGDEGITDKAESVADDAVDKGIKGVKYAAGAKLAGDAGLAAMTAMMGMKMLMMLKGMGLAMLGKVAGFFGGIFSAASSFVSGLLGVTAGIGQVITAGLMSVVVGAAGILGYGAVETLTKKDDSVAECVPTNTRVPQGSQDYIFGEGGVSVIHEEHATKLWSVYSELGASKAQTAAVLGNLHLESSGLDPTATETIYNEPFAMGPRKQDAMNKDYLISLVNPSYSARFPAIKYMGIGLAQWTNGRNRLLIDFANSQGVNWFEFDTQVRFMLVGDDPRRQKQLTTFLNSPTSNVSRETERFMNTWIGLSSPNPSLTGRQGYATEYMFVLERAEVDSAYAESILSGLNVNRSEGNAAAGAYHQDDGCGKPVKSHYANQAVDGTGEVPAGLLLVPWSRETLPDSLREYVKNPEDAGLTWGNSSGWANGIIPDQCVALATSYFMKLYPGWNQNGRPGTRPFGNGKDTAQGWASHYREKIVPYPSAGAVFSDSTTSSYGHTGIVQHVFANGDILIVEQNVRGVSGEAAGLSYSWSWRVIKKDRYLQAKWKFFKPAGEEPQWGGSGN